MAQYSEELLRALAHGDEQAHETIKDLPITVRMGIGVAVDELRRKENIIPQSNGFSIYEQQKSNFIDEDAVGKAMANRMEAERAERERQKKIHEEYIAEQTKRNIERSRLGLPKNGIY